MSRAYDRVEWSFLDALLPHMGFPPLWCALLRSCYASVSYSILINGRPTGLLYPERGLRQGDPLSPYLFILVGHCLSCMLDHAEASRSLRGIKLFRRSATFSHLLFADDIIFFSTASLDQARVINDIIHTYGSATGQLINKRKSGLFFSPNTPKRFCRMIGCIFRCKILLKLDWYLGIPMQFGLAKSVDFQLLRDRVISKVQGWKSSLLSWAVASNGGSSHMMGLGATSVPTASTLWKSIWQAKLPRKIQFFLWRACSNALAVGSILARRHIAMGVSCPWCGDTDESIEHCLMMCNFARAVLFSSPLAIHHRPTASQSFREWWLLLVNRLRAQPDKDTLVLTLASVLWFLWKARNEKLFSSLSCSPRSIVARASAFAAEVQSVWSPTRAMSTRPSSFCWVPPPLGLIKLNCDGAFFVGETLGGAGVVGRDSTGCVLDFRVQVVRCASAIMAEAKAIVLGVSLASERGWTNIVVESDSLSLILVLQSPGDVFPLEVAVLMEDLRVAIHSFASVSFSFSPRATNGLAHWLAST
ncbi:hypothetical protein HHK36_005927 [Tetracentron sinense]|uniref:Reverse transcriptase domain-containing protein n=1 Tax=Tetracentron sinense TaxID=13715 RepID=A0A834ZNG2_TETSI|nr:hypothetical protein HHK36_005927 [Tetracentron sinense]